MSKYKEGLVVTCLGERKRGVCGFRRRGVRDERR